MTRMNVLLAIAALVALVWISGIFDPDDSFHPNGKTISAGALVCPDSVATRSEFHKGIQGQKIMNQIARSGDSEAKNLHALLEATSIYKTDFSAFGCSELESGSPIYIENEDATGIAAITAKLPNTTLLHGITYASEIKSDSSGQ